MFSKEPRITAAKLDALPQKRDAYVPLVLHPVPSNHSRLGSLRVRGEAGQHELTFALGQQCPSRMSQEQRIAQNVTLRWVMLHIEFPNAVSKVNIATHLQFGNHGMQAFRPLWHGGWCS